MDTDVADVHADLKNPFKAIGSLVSGKKATRSSIISGYALDRSDAYADLNKPNTILRLALFWANKLNAIGDASFETLAVPLSFSKRPSRQVHLALSSESGKNYIHDDPLSEFVQVSTNEASQEGIPFIQGLSVTVARLIGRPNIELKSLVTDATTKKSASSKMLTLSRSQWPPVKLKFPAERIVELKNGPMGQTAAIFFPNRAVPESMSLNDAFLRENDGFTVIVLDGSGIRWIIFCDYNPAFTSLSASGDVAFAVPPPTDVLPPPSLISKVEDKKSQARFGHMFSAIDAPTNKGMLDDDIKSEPRLSQLDTTTDLDETMMSKDMESSQGSQGFTSISPAMVLPAEDAVAKFYDDSDKMEVDKPDALPWWWPADQLEELDTLRRMRSVGDLPQNFIPLHGTSGFAADDDFYSFGADLDSADLKESIKIGSKTLWMAFIEHGLVDSLKFGPSSKTHADWHYRSVRMQMFSMFVRLSTEIMIGDIATNNYMSFEDDTHETIRESLTNTTLRHIGVAFLTAAIRLRWDFYTATVKPIEDKNRVSGFWVLPREPVTIETLTNCRGKADILAAPLDVTCLDFLSNLKRADSRVQSSGLPTMLSRPDDDMFVSWIGKFTPYFNILIGFVPVLMALWSFRYDVRAARSIGVTMAINFQTSMQETLGSVFNNVKNRTYLYDCGSTFMFAAASAYLYQGNMSHSHIEAVINAANTCNNFEDLVALTSQVVNGQHYEATTTAN